MTYVLPTVSNIGATQGVTSYDCGAQQAFIRVVATVTGVGATATKAPTGSNAQASSSAQTTIDTSAGKPTLGVPNPADPTTSNSSSSSNSGSRLSTGAIVGIAIGVVAAILIVLVIVWCFTKPWGCRPRKKKDFITEGSSVGAGTKINARRLKALNNRGRYEMT
jgi:hypothetical protein